MAVAVAVAELSVLWLMCFSRTAVRPLFYALRAFLTRLITCLPLGRGCVLLCSMLCLLFIRISRCVVGFLVCSKEGENFRQRKDGFLRTEPLAQGALDGLGGSH